MADIEQIGGETDDGMQLGAGSSSKVGFYGTTPVDQPSGRTIAATTFTSTVVTTALAVDVAALRASLLKVTQDLEECGVLATLN